MIWIGIGIGVIAGFFAGCAFMTWIARIAAQVEGAIDAAAEGIK